MAQGKSIWPLVGALAAAVGSGMRCAGPLSLGISGAWIGHLTSLGPYRPLMIGAAGVLLGLRGGGFFGGSRLFVHRAARVQSLASSAIGGCFSGLPSPPRC